VHQVGILYDQFMMHGQRNIKISWLLKMRTISCPEMSGFIYLAAELWNHA